MELTLNIYQGGKVEKTYTANEFDLMFGTVEDLVALIDLNAFTAGNEMEVAASVMKMLREGIGTVNHLLKEVFDGLTDEEIKKTKVKELVVLLVTLVKYSVEEIRLVGTGKK